MNSAYGNIPPLPASGSCLFHLEFLKSLAVPHDPVPDLPSISSAPLCAIFSEQGVDVRGFFRTRWRAWPPP